MAHLTKSRSQKQGARQGLTCRTYEGTGCCPCGRPMPILMRGKFWLPCKAEASGCGLSRQTPALPSTGYGTVLHRPAVGCCARINHKACCRGGLHPRASCCVLSPLSKPYLEMLRDALHAVVTAMPPLGTQPHLQRTAAASARSSNMTRAAPAQLCTCPTLLPELAMPCKHSAAQNRAVQCSVALPTPWRWAGPGRHRPPGYAPAAPATCVRVQMGGLVRLDAPHILTCGCMCVCM